MKIAPIVPRAPEVIREALIVLAGAMIAAALVRGLPIEYRRWFSWPAADQ